jgi:hypothetical protein
MENLASNQSRLSLRHCLVINFNSRRPSPCLAPSVEDVVTLRLWLRWVVKVVDWSACVGRDIDTFYSLSI